MSAVSLFSPRLRFLSETRKRFRFMLSSMSAATSAPTRNDFFKISETVRASGFTIHHRGGSPRESLHYDRKWRHKLLPVGSKSHKRVNVGPCSDRDFSIMVQPIPNGFTVLETAVQKPRFSLCNLLDIFASWPRKWLKWAYRRLHITRIAVFYFLGNC